MKRICCGFALPMPHVFAAMLFAVASSSMAGDRQFKVQGPTDPKAWEKTAAEELEHYLGMRLGAMGASRPTGGYPLTVDGQDGVVFHVGDTEFAKKKKKLKENMRIIL